MAINGNNFSFYVFTLGCSTEEEEEMWGRVGSWADRSVGSGHCCWVCPHLQYSKRRPALHSGKNSSTTGHYIWPVQLKYLKTFSM